MNHELSYADILKTVFGPSLRQGMRCSLSNVEQLCKIYKEPQLSFPTIHVAGTNGKGSVCTKIAAALRLGGL